MSQSLQKIDQRTDGEGRSYRCKLNNRKTKKIADKNDNKSNDAKPDKNLTKNITEDKKSQYIE